RAAQRARARVAVAVDDGVRTGGTAVAALRWARAQGAERVVLAVPVAPPQTLERLRAEADAGGVVEAPAPCPPAHPRAPPRGGRRGGRARDAAAVPRGGRVVPGLRSDHRRAGRLGARPGGGHAGVRIFELVVAGLF